MSYIKGLQENDLGSAIDGRAITATLYVSPDGDNSDGSTREKAFNTINGALDAASTDVNDVTLIMVAPHDTYYDIDTAGDPTWSANVEIMTTHRIWAVFRNTNAGATSILKLTGKASVTDIAFSQHGAVSGLILTKSGYRVRNCGFNSSVCTGAVNDIELDGSAGLMQGGKIEGCQFIGHASYTTAIHATDIKVLEACDLNIHGALVGISLNGASTVSNFFNHTDIGVCGTGIDIVAGTGTHFSDSNFHANTVNISEGVTTNNVWHDMHGEFAVGIYPEDRAGIEVTCGDTVWGSDTEIRAAATATKPFKVIGYSLDPSHEESTLIRISADSGSTFFVTDVFADKKGKASGGGPGTDFIFSQGTRISASCLSPDTGRTVNVWLEIQEI